LDVLKQTHLKGILNWNGVEMENCGQADTTRGAIDFNLAPSDETSTVSVVTNSAIHNCPGVCVNIEGSADITLTNNNIYNSRPISMRIYDASNLIIQNNHFVAALVRDYTYDTTNMVYDFTGHIYFYSKTSVINNHILITGNVA
jgi:parallel beta-helix repeat protein